MKYSKSKCYLYIGEEVPNKGHFRKSKSVLNRTLSRGVSSLGLGMKKTKTDSKLTEKELSWHDSETMSISIHDSSYRTNDSSIRANELSVSIHNTSIRSNGSSRNSGSNRSIESSANTNIRNSRLSNASKLRDVGRCSRVLEISNDTNNEYLPSGISPYIGIQGIFFIIYYNLEQNLTSLSLYYNIIILF